MEFVKTPFKEEITVKSIITVHYFEYDKDHNFHGEKHNFWEFVYVDKGEVEVMADTTGYNLKHGEIIFHKPNEFHKLWANGKTAPNLVIITFECRSPSMRYFEGKIIKADDSEKDYLANIIREAKNAYASPLDDTYQTKIEKKKSPPFGSEQLIRINLELFLISLIRKGKSMNKSTRLSPITQKRYEKERIGEVTDFLRANLYRSISFDDVSRHLNQSKTSLKLLFKSVKGVGVMEYYRSLKIDEAKRLIREMPLSFTEIAESLGYSSLHYFSRHFKNATGMTPTEYAKSVKASEASE